MMTVAILINGNVIMARSARRVEGNDGEICKYKVDDGRIIRHKPEDGAIDLAIEMLRGISE